MLFTLYLLCHWIFRILLITEIPAGAAAVAIGASKAPAAAMELTPAFTTRGCHQCQATHWLFSVLLQPPFLAQDQLLHQLLPQDTRLYLVQKCVRLTLVFLVFTQVTFLGFRFIQNLCCRGRGLRQLRHIVHIRLNVTFLGGSASARCSPVLRRIWRHVVGPSPSSISDVTHSRCRCLSWHPGQGSCEF
jgi:hypothetical protein